MGKGIWGKWIGLLAETPRWATLQKAKKAQPRGSENKKAVRRKKKPAAVSRLSGKSVSSRRKEQGGGPKKKGQETEGEHQKERFRFTPPTPRRPRGNDHPDEGKPREEKEKKEK